MLGGGVTASPSNPRSKGYSLLDSDTNSSLVPWPFQDSFSSLINQVFLPNWKTGVVGRDGNPFSFSRRNEGCRADRSAEEWSSGHGTHRLASSKYPALDDLCIRGQTQSLSHFTRYLFHSSQVFSSINFKGYWLHTGVFQDPMMEISGGIPVQSSWRWMASVGHWVTQTQHSMQSSGRIVSDFSDSIR